MGEVKKNSPAGGPGGGDDGLELAPAPDDITIKNEKKQAPTLTIEAAKFARDLAQEELRRVLDEVVYTIKKFVVLPDYAAEAIALYVLQTWLIEKCEFAPMLLFTSPEMRSGKTTLLTLLAELVREPESAANASPAALFRLIEATAPTLMLDEVDAFLNQKTETTEAVRGILNAGHRRGRFSCVLRVEAVKDGQFTVTRFSVFGHKILAGIGSVPATWRDRSILIPLRRKTPDERVSSFRVHRLQGDLDTLRAKIAQTAEIVTDYIDTAFDPPFPDGLHDRGRDNWELSLLLARFAGGDWPQLAASAALAFSGLEDDTGSAGIMLLEDVKEFFSQTARTGIFTDELLDYLHGLEERPWSAWSRGKPISAAQIARILRNYDIRPGVLSSDGIKKRGYRLESFADAFSRYTSPDFAVTPLPDGVNSLQDNDLDGNGQGNGLHSKPLPQAESNTLECNPLPEVLPDNSIQDKELCPGGNAGTGETGEGGSTLWF